MGPAISRPSKQPEPDKLSSPMPPFFMGGGTEAEQPGEWTTAEPEQSPAWSAPEPEQPSDWDASEPEASAETASEAHPTRSGDTADGSDLPWITSWQHPEDAEPTYLGGVPEVDLDAPPEHARGAESPTQQAQPGEPEQQLQSARTPEPEWHRGREPESTNEPRILHVEQAGDFGAAGASTAQATGGFSEAADRLEGIARSLRERSASELLQSGDPFEALIVGYVMGQASRSTGI
jgi:hypothetical protein